MKNQISFGKLDDILPKKNLYETLIQDFELLWWNPDSADLVESWHLPYAWTAIHRHYAQDWSSRLLRCAQDTWPHTQTLPIFPIRIGQAWIGQKRCCQPKCWAELVWYQWVCCKLFWDTDLSPLTCPLRRAKKSTARKTQTPAPILTILWWRLNMVLQKAFEILLL